MKLDSNQKLTIIGLIVAIFVGSGYYFYQNFLIPEKPQNILLDNPASPNEITVTSEVIVNISGAVKHEGVYRLSKDARIYNVIALAGGTLCNADLSSINLAEKLKDGEKVLIPCKLREIEGIEGGRGSVRDGGKRKSWKKISINRASFAELDELPGVGPATAKKIVEARPFHEISDLQKIPRFGKSKYDKLKDKICL